MRILCNQYVVFMGSLPRDTLAKNLKWLMQANGHSCRDLEKLSGVSAKTINNMQETRNDVLLDKVEAVAAAYGLTAWHLISPTMVRDVQAGQIGERILEYYNAASDDGKKLIEMVAERESKRTA